DALHFATDLDAALRELCRLLKPGARAVIASREAESIGPAGRTWSAWLRAIGRSGLRLEQRLTEHGRQQRWRALYDLWRTHEAELRAEIGDAPTDLLIEEARDVQALTSHRPMLLVLRRPS